MKTTVLFILAFFPIVSFAQFGVLDNDFDANGTLQLRVDNYETLAQHVLVQNDGKILVCGQASDNLGFVYRLFPDGSLDNSFGVNGRVTLTSRIIRMALLPDGDIIIAGDLVGQQLGSGFNVLKLSGAAGELVENFGSSGSTLVEFQNASFASLRDMQLTPDGKVVLVGELQQQDSDVVLARLNSDGNIDQTFSFDGQVVTDISVVDVGQAAVIGNDGKITVAGFVNIGPGDFAALLIRYNADGTLDQSFGNNGFVQTDISPGFDAFYGITADGSGNLYACGMTVWNGVQDMLVARFLPDGTIDTEFGGLSGTVVIDLNAESDRARDILVLPDSRILVVGESMINGSFHPAAFRLMPNGTADNTFGNGGAVLTQAGLEGKYDAVALQGDLKILATGSIIDVQFNERNAIVARYTSGMNVGIGEVDAYIGSTLVYPNPIVDNSITLEYELKSDESVSIEFFDLAGKMVTQLQPVTQQIAGSYQKTFELPALSAGNYLLKLNTEKGAVTVKLQLL